MPDSDTGERVTPVLDYPSRDGLAVQAVRVDYAPGGFSRVHRHPAGAYVYVIDGSVMFGIGGGGPVPLEAGGAFSHPPRAPPPGVREERGGKGGGLLAVFPARARGGPDPGMR